MRTNENETYVALNEDRIYRNQKRKKLSKYGQERIAVNVINIHYNEAMEVATSITSFRYLKPSQDMSESIKDPLLDTNPVGPRSSTRPTCLGCTSISIKEIHLHSIA